MKKSTFYFFIAIMLLALGVHLAFVFVTQYQTESVDTSVSPDGKYTLALDSIGQPEFPYGSAHGRIALTRNGKKVSKAKIDLADDGCQINKESWKVNWKEDCVEVVLHACEQEDENWCFYFNGKIDEPETQPVEENSSTAA